MDNKTREQRSANMRRIKNKDSKIEVALRKALWDNGFRYRKNYTKIPGKPDIVLVSFKIAIFCDSEFFHGKDWDNLRRQLEKSNNSEFWINKISRNIERDEEVNRELRALGWTVLRFWGKDILNNPQICVDAVFEVIHNLL